MNQQLVVPLAEVTAANGGGKAAPLGSLLRSGFPVPPGVVVTVAAFHATRADQTGEVAEAVRRWLTAALTELGHPPVAVRSSATDEDGELASAAGQYDSVLGVSGPEAVWAAVHACWASAQSDRARSYRQRATPRADPSDPPVAVLVQRLVDAEVSGVLFTPSDPDQPTRIEANWGLGLSTVGGTVLPDTTLVSADRRVHTHLGSKHVRVDRNPQEGLITREVPPELRDRSALSAGQALRLARMGSRVAEHFRSPQDIEWALVGKTLWVLQARAITAPLPAPLAAPLDSGAERTGFTLRGSPASGITATGGARVLASPDEAPRVLPGDIVVCASTDPAWTPLFRIAGGIITEFGGLLSHAAIVAREHRIAATVGVTHATRFIPDGARVSISGSTGIITVQ